MTAPGDNLDFSGSRIYRNRIKNFPELQAIIESYLKNRPAGGREIAVGIRELAISAGDGNFVVFYSRRGNRIGLAAVFEVREVRLIEGKRAELIRLFGGLGK